jgi:hypothetical protein
MTGLKQKRRLYGTALRKLRLRTGYHFPLPLQAFAGCSRVRRCVACEKPVRNKNLGGNNGGSALVGPVWCYECADWPQQRLLELGGAN